MGRLHGFLRPDSTLGLPGLFFRCKGHGQDGASGAGISAHPAPPLFLPVPPRGLWSQDLQLPETSSRRGEEGEEVVGWTEMDWEGIGRSLRWQHIEVSQPLSPQQCGRIKFSVLLMKKKKMTDGNSHGGVSSEVDVILDPRVPSQMKSQLLLKVVTGLINTDHLGCLLFLAFRLC